jgi:hypothetical protein
MPFRDGTGPMGDGRPGRGLGPCGRGGSFAFGRRANRRCRNRWQLTDSYRAEYQYSREDLATEKKELEAQLEWINKELEK